MWLVFRNDTKARSIKEYNHKLDFIKIKNILFLRNSLFNTMERQGKTGKNIDKLLHSDILRMCICRLSVSGLFQGMPSPTAPTHTHMHISLRPSTLATFTVYLRRPQRARDSISLPQGQYYYLINMIFLQSVQFHFLSFLWYPYEGNVEKLYLGLHVLQHMEDIYV